MYRLIVRVVAAVLPVVFISASASAGPRSYDISSLLFERYPLRESGSAFPTAGLPVSPSQIRAPARMPQPGPPSRSFARPAAEPTESDRMLPATAQSLAVTPPPESREGLRSVLSEIRVGLLVHDQGPFSSHEESGLDGNFELLFVSPSIFHVILSPRPHIGFSLNSNGNTSHVYAGLTWQWSFWRHWFAEFGGGGSLNNGETLTDRTDRKELGCHLLFRGSVSLGYRFGGHHSVSAFLEHISNGTLCAENEGLDNVGIRYGYMF